MKTAEKLVATLQISDLQLTVEIVNLIREYGAQVREEAAKIADKAESANLQGLDIDTSPEAIAAAIRKMELP